MDRRVVRVEGEPDTQLLCEGKDGTNESLKVHPQLL